MIGIAFSLGFTVGPLMGAYFAVSSRTTGNVFYQTPALLALAFSVADLLFIWLTLPETLTKDVKVGYGDIHTDNGGQTESHYLRKMCFCAVFSQNM